MIDDLSEEEKRRWEAGIHEEPQTGNTGKSDIITNKHWNEWRNHDVIAQTGNILIPVCIIQAGNDKVALPKHAEELTDKLSYGYVYKTIGGANHVFKNEDGMLMENQIKESVSTSFSEMFTLK